MSTPPQEGPYDEASNDHFTSGTMPTPLDELLDSLKALPSEDGLMNPYHSASGPGTAAADEIGAEADALRTRNLRRYLTNALDQGADVILCGEAPGYQGCRYSGIAFTSEVEIVRGGFSALEGTAVLPRARNGGRTLMREPSAQAIWEAMHRAPKAFIAWNSVCLHPHEPGQPHTNRTPRKDEVTLGAESLGRLLDLVQPRLVVAVGRTAERALEDLDVDAAAVRHPAYGGKPEMLQGLEALGVIGPRQPPQASLF